MLGEALFSVRRALETFFTEDGYRILIGWLASILAADYLTAVLCALLGKAKHGKNLSSSIGFTGIVKKSMVFVVVGIAFVVDQALGVNAFCGIAIRGFIINEAISTLQNISLIGTWIPPALQNGLSRLQTGDSPEGKDSKSQQCQS